MFKKRARKSLSTDICEWYDKSTIYPGPGDPESDIIHTIWSKLIGKIKGTRLMYKEYETRQLAEYHLAVALHELGMYI